MFLPGTGGVQFPGFPSTDRGGKCVVMMLQTQWAVPIMASAQHRAPPHDDSAGEPKTKKSRQQLSLVFQPQVPRYPFVKEFFEVTVYLFDDSNQVKCGYV